MIFSLREDLFTIQFGSLEAVVIPLLAQISTVETGLASNEGEGWTVVTRLKPRKPKQPHAPPLDCRKRQGNKNPRHTRSKKRSKINERQEIQPADLLEQELLVHVTLEEFFPIGFFDKVTVNMISCYEMEDEKERNEEKLEKPSESKEKTLTILEALPTYTDWRQIFNLPEEIRQYVVVGSTQSSMLTKSRKLKN